VIEAGVLRIVFDAGRVIGLRDGGLGGGAAAGRAVAAAEAAVDPLLPWRVSK
jgi:hypothetical protein